LPGDDANNRERGDLWGANSETGLIWPVFFIHCQHKQVQGVFLTFHTPEGRAGNGVEQMQTGGNTMNHRLRICIYTLLAVALALIVNGEQPSLAEGTTIYVDADATGANNGSSWEDAFTDLQPALDAAATYDQVWVAAGTYLPTHEYTPGDPRSVSFQMKNSVEIYGGFAGTESSIDERDWMIHSTVLSCDLNGDDGPDFTNNTENCYHVLYHPSGLGLNSSSTLDGFTIRGGNASGGTGGGMYNFNSSPTLRNCTFTSNSAASGGGLYNDYYSSPTMTGVTFLGNSAAYGGGMYNYYGSSPILTGCNFGGNTASYAGGGIYNYVSTPSLVGCTFTGNTGVSAGGGVYNNSSSPTFTDCTFAGNSGGLGGGMNNADGASPTLINCTFLSNSSVNGGGMYNSYYSTMPMLTSCTFIGNSASSEGGGMHNYGANPTVVNATFSRNSAAYGGGMYNASSAGPGMTNCTFYGNTASIAGGGIYNYWYSPPYVTNTILWGNTPTQISNDTSEPTVTYSDVQGGYTGLGNIDANPLFVDPINDDFHLAPGSPAIDAGSNAAGYLPAYDFEGDARVLDGNNDGYAVVDIGVDETQPLPHQAQLIFVAQTATGANDGTSWADAFTTLQPALDAAVSGDQIWVAEGTYKPTFEFTPGNPRSVSFQMKNGVEIYGGFAGIESSLEERDWATNRTILSGDLGIEGDISDNSYHVFFHPEGTVLDNSAILDGFTITGGNATGAWPPQYIGGGMVNINVSPTLANCTFSGNTASYGGGGMSNYNSSPILTNCAFKNNSGYGGGGMRNTSSSPVLTNCTFSGNTATSGAGIFNDSSSPRISNSIFWGDTPDEIYNSTSSPVITYSDIQGGYTGIGNINADPLFIDPSNGDLHLMPDSPCIDAGTNAAPYLPLIDFDGDARILDGDGDGTVIVDMGVDEALSGGLTPLEVEVDIKPSTPQNSLRFGSRGTLPVAILTTVDFDATTVDPSTVLFAGAMPERWELQDADRDGDVDLLLYFMIVKLSIDLNTTEITLTATTYDGLVIYGTDTVNIIFH
jgi:hypothetical protein